MIEAVRLEIFSPDLPVTAVTSLVNELVHPVRFGVQKSQTLKSKNRRSVDKLFFDDVNNTSGKTANQNCLLRMATIGDRRKTKV